MRIILMLLGLVCVGLGIAGLILPVMPGTVFFILAAVLFAKSNPVWEAKIMEHPTIGPPVRRFRDRGVIPPLAKAIAVGSMVVASIGSWFLLKGYWAYVPAGLCSVCAAYVLTRPSR